MEGVISSASQLNETSISHLFAHTLHLSPHLVYILNKDGQLVGYNKNFIEFFNLTTESVAPPCNFYKLLGTHTTLSAERIALLKSADINAIVSGEPELNQLEAPMVFNQQPFYACANRFPILNKNKVVGLVVFMEDISELVQLKEQVSLMKGQLQQQNKQQNVSVGKTPVVPTDIIPQVLLIEDNSIAQKAVQAILMQLDCKVEIAETADEALQLFKPGKYNIIFMDIGLQDTSGYVVAKQLRQLEKDSGYHCTIIALTGYEADIVKFDCLDYAMEGAITKPLTTEQAKQIIQHYIHQIDIPVSGLKSI